MAEQMADWKAVVTAAWKAGRWVNRTVALRAGK
jgi:hypothetical protein